MPGRLSVKPNLYYCIAGGVTIPSFASSAAIFSFRSEISFSRSSISLTALRPVFPAFSAFFASFLAFLASFLSCESLFNFSALSWLLEAAVCASRAEEDTFSFFSLTVFSRAASLSLLSLRRLLVSRSSFSCFSTLMESLLTSCACAEKPASAILIMLIIKNFFILFVCITLYGNNRAPNGHRRKTVFNCDKVVSFTPLQVFIMCFGVNGCTLCQVFNNRCL